MMLKSNSLVVILKKVRTLYVGFSKGFLSDLIGTDRVVDISRGQPARRRWQDETMVISCKTMHVVVV